MADALFYSIMIMFYSTMTICYPLWCAETNKRLFIYLFNHYSSGSHHIKPSPNPKIDVLQKSFLQIILADI